MRCWSDEVAALSLLMKRSRFAPRRSEVPARSLLDTINAPFQSRRFAPRTLSPVVAEGSDCAVVQEGAIVRHEAVVLAFYVRLYGGRTEGRGGQEEVGTRHGDKAGDGKVQRALHSRRAVQSRGW